MRLRTILSIYLGFRCLGLLCQAPTYGTAAYFGFIAPHNPEMVRLITGHSFGFSAFADWQTTGKAKWHADYYYPSHRLDFIFIHTGNLVQLGYQHALTYQIRLPLDKINNRQQLLMGMGPGYATKKWDIETNRQGFVLGSHFNMALILGYQYVLYRTATFDTRIGLRVTHLSNGAFTMPNAGTNHIALQLECRFGKSTNAMAQPSLDTLPRLQSALIGGVGLKEIQPPNSRKYSVFSLQNQWSYQVNRKSSFVAQADVMVNTSNPVIEAENEGPMSKQKTRAMCGVTIGYQLRFGKIGLIMQQGIYVIDPYGYNGLLYHRVGLRTHGSGPLFFHLALKTHFAKADHGELGIGYTFYRKGHLKQGGHK
jgi:hypothetical protein